MCEEANDRTLAGEPLDGDGIRDTAQQLHFGLPSNLQDTNACLLKIGAESSEVMSLRRALGEDDTGPLLTLGDRVVWLFEHGPEHGWVRWIGRIPVVSPNWAVGVEFDNPIGAGDGKFGGKRYFYARNDHAYFLPNSSLLRAADYNSSFRKENAMATDAMATPGHQAKMYTFPHRYSAAKCPFPGSANPGGGGRVTEVHLISSSRDGQPHSVCSSSKLHRSQSTRLQGGPSLCDYDNWLGGRGDPCNVHVKSWKSSSTHSVVSCPPVLLPKMLVARELTSSSDSEVNFGTLRSLMSCFTLGSHRRKKRRKKKKKSHRLVIATGPNHSNYCYSGENAAATQARQLVCEKERGSERGSQELDSAKVRVSGGPKAMWRYSLQEQDLPKRDPPSKEPVTRHATEQKGPPKLPPKTSSKKKRLAPQPPDGTTTPTGSLPRPRPVPPAAGPGSSSAHSTESLSLTRRKSHKKPAPQPPARDAWRSVTRGATLPTAKQMGVYANEGVEHSKGTAALKGHTLSVSSALEMSSSSLVRSYSLKSQQAQEKQEFGINLVNMVIKPDLPVKTIPVSKPAAVNENAVVIGCDGSSEGIGTSIRQVAKTPDGTGKPELGRTGISGGEKRDALKHPVTDREVRSSTLPPTRQCPPILEEEEPYATTTIIGEPNNLESVLKRNSNVFELLDAFSKLELNSEEVQEDSQPESPKQQRKQAKSLKSLFQKHPADASKVVSTKWTYTPMEVKKENIFGVLKPASTSPARHQNSGEVDHKVGNSNDPSPSSSSEAQFGKKPQPPSSLDTPLASCRMNLKPVSHSPDFGSVLCKLRPQTSDSSPENPPWKRQLEALKVTANKAGPSSGAPVLPPEAENSAPGGRKDGNSAGENGASCAAVVAASSPEMMAGRASPSPAASARSSARTSPGRQRPPMHPNSPTALMQAKLPALFRQLEEAISKGEHDRAAILARELAMYKVSCSLRRVRKVADPKQFTVKMYVEDKKSHVGPISLPVHPEMTLSNLKRKIEAEYNFPVRVQRWILGKNLATDDGATLEQYGVSHSACPVFLYLVSPAEELKADEVLQKRRWKPPDSIASTEEGTEELALAAGRRAPSEASSTLDALLNDHMAGWTCQLCGINNTEPDTCAMCGVAMVTEGASHSGGNVDHRPTTEDAGAWVEPVHGGRLELDQAHLLQDDQLQTDGIPTNVDIPPDGGYTEVDIPPTKENGGIPEEKDNILPPRMAISSPQDYSRLVELEEQDLVPSMEAFECSICFLDVEPGKGVLLRDCLHMFCRDCLSNSVRYAEEAMVKCPFRNDEYSCSSHLQEREIRALVSAEVYEHHLSRSVKTAESQALNSFHCQTADCPGWCMLEDNVNVFLCPVCGHANCLTCRAIHEGKNCLQYQDELDFNAPDGHEARQTKEYLDNMVKEGQAMHCPQCRVIVMKKWGCDWLKCSVCQTEICWVTKGPRWGPQGKGDTSAGCKCGVNGVKCHPKCNYCH